MVKDKKLVKDKKINDSATKDVANGKGKAKLAAPSALTNTGADKNQPDKSQPLAVDAANVKATIKATVMAPDVAADDDLEVILTDAEGRRYCRATDCDQIGMVDGYCRYHYLYFWKKIQNRKKILADGKLDRYIEELTSRYADKFVELLRKDLRTEKDFMAAIQELELDDSAQASAQDEDETKTYLEEISGVATESSTRDDDGY